jgi:hypothetical protein
MVRKAEEEFVRLWFQLFQRRRGGDHLSDFSPQINEIFKTIEKTPLEKMLAPEDLREFFDWVVTKINKWIEHITDEEFIAQLKSDLLTTKTYDFYVPIYCLYGFPENAKLGYSTVIDFQNLPTEISEHFVMFWERCFTIDTQYHTTKEEYVSLKKRSTFIHFVIEANGSYKAIEKAISRAEDALHIVRFLYRINFNIVDMRYKTREIKQEGGRVGMAGLPFIGCVNYGESVGKEIPILTDIFVKSNPNEIEEKIRKTLRIFGIQTSVKNQQVRFVLLVTCLESLLMTKFDRDYILWRLAEKVALISDDNKRDLYDYVRKEAYEKRSAFIHGNEGKDNLVTENDILKIEGVVSNLVWRMIDLVKDGYTHVRKEKGVKSIDEYVEETKFGKTSGNHK